jgi:hypothetical protein
VPSTTFALTDRIANPASNPSVYECIQPGTSGTTGPIGTDATVDTTLDGSCLWTYLGAGAAAADVLAESEDVGPVVGAPRDITQIVNETLGWRGVTNVAEAELGRVVAGDPELRILREEELGGAGSAPFDALLAALLRVAGVTSVALFVNNADTTDAAGVPPHAIEALIRGGADQDVFDQLFRSAAAGVGLHGNQAGTAVDSQGVSHPVQFSRVVEVPIFVTMSVATGPKYPQDGNMQVQNATVAFGAAQDAGRDAVTRALEAQAFQVTGVVDVLETAIFTDRISAAATWAPSTSYVATRGARSVVTNDAGRKYICTTAGVSASSGGPIGPGADITDGTAHWRYLGQNVTIGPRELATFSPANITVTSSSGSP